VKKEPEITIFSPQILTQQEFEKREKIRKTFGQKIVDAIQTLDAIAHELQQDSAKMAHVGYQLVENFIKVLSTQDPNQIHFEIVRKALTIIDPTLLSDTQAIDSLARELISFCVTFKMKLISNKPKEFKKTYVKEKNNSERVIIESGAKVPKILFILELTEEDIPKAEKEFEINGMLLHDHLYLETLKKAGKRGKEAAKQIEPKLQEQFKKYRANKSPLTLWFNISPSPGQPVYASIMLQTLIKVILEDKVRKKLSFRDKYEPAITRSTHEPLTNMHSPKSTVIINRSQIQLLHPSEPQIVGKIEIPTMSPKIFETIFSGVKKFKTVTAHRLVRFFALSPFEKMIRGNQDYRVAKYDRGATEIAELLDIKSKKQITNIKDIVHAMAYFELQLPQSSGNLIALRKYLSPKTHRNEGYEITTGTLLLPYNTFEAYKKGECGLLIPIPPDPPLVGSNRFHANQYLLQMEIMGEFSNQSIRLEQEGIIEISQEKWQILQRSCGLNPEILKKIHDRWTRDGDDGAQFLIEVEPGFYTLGKEYEKQLTFFKEQGLLRKRQVSRGRKSAAKRKLINNR